MLLCTWSCLINQGWVSRRHWGRGWHLCGGWGTHNLGVGEREIGEEASWAEEKLVPGQHAALRGLWMPRPGWGPSRRAGGYAVASSLSILFSVIATHVPGEGPGCGRSITRIFHAWWCVRSILSDKSILSLSCLTIYCLYEGNWVREWPLRILGVRCSRCACSRGV